MSGNIVILEHCLIIMLVKTWMIFVTSTVLIWTILSMRGKVYSNGVLFLFFLFLWRFYFRLVVDPF